MDEMTGQEKCRENPRQEMGVVSHHSLGPQHEDPRWQRDVVHREPPPKTTEVEAEQAHRERHALHDGCWQEEDNEQRKENAKTMIRVGQ